MMYLPDAFRESQSDALYGLIESYGFATLISPDADDPLITHLPLLVDRGRGPNSTLVGHFARANPHWRRLEQRPQVLAVFHGPHGYVSPSWYGEHPSVPTWNYAVVHAHGRARLLQDPDAVESIVRRLVAKYEDPRPQPWPMNLPDEYRRRMLAGIVGVEIELTQLTGKFKLSQNRTPDDRRRVVAALQSGPPHDQELASLMSRLVLPGLESDR